MSTIEKRLGAKISEIRLSQKLTQAELAEKINVSVETVSRLERGVSVPSLKTIENIAVSLNTTLTVFFDFEGQPPISKKHERELSKLMVFLRTLQTDELSLAHELIKEILNIIKKRPIAYK